MKKNLILSTLYQILCIITPIITAPYVSRVLGPEGVGIYSYTHSIQMYFSLFAALGVTTYGSREIARNRNDRQAYSKLFWEIQIMVMLTSCVCLAAWFILCYSSGAYRVYYLVLTFALLGTMMDISWFYTGLEQFQYIVLQNSLFKLLGVVAVFLFVKEETDLAIYIAIMSLATLLGNLSMWAYLPKFINKVALGKLKLRVHFHETLIYFIPTVATSIYTILDKTLIGAITQDASENGYYEQATKIINIAKSVTFAGLNSVLGSRIAYLFAENKTAEIKTRIAQSMDYILFIGIGACFGILGVAKRFVPFFFGAGYEKTIDLLMLMSPLIIIIGISNCLGSQYYNPAGLRALSAKFIIAGSCINLVLNVLLIPRFESMGAVYATLAAEGAIAALYLRFCNGYVSIADLVKRIWKKLIAGIVMLVCVCLIGETVASAMLAVTVQLLAGCAVYAVLLLFMRDSFIVDLVLPQLRKKKWR